MPVEIRELVIKTNIVAGEQQSDSVSKQHIAMLKQQVVQECLKALKREKALLNDDER